MNSLKVIFISITTIFVFIAAPIFGQGCNVKITSPANGTHVDGQGLVSGIVNLPYSGYLWIFARKAGFNAWWPQGNGTAEVLGNDWEVLVHYGTKEDDGKFDVIALVVDEQTNLDLEKWSKNSKAENYPPIALPKSIDGCTFSRIRVQKNKD